MVIQMYSRGITTTEIAEIIEKMYGCYYTPATISNITKTTSEIVHEFHSRNVSKRYIVIYGDATYINVRRDTVQKEALPILMGITADGNKEILDYQLFPKAQYQACWVYLMRSICRNIRNKDMKEIMADVKLIYQSRTEEEVQEQLSLFVTAHEKKYPKAVKILKDNPSLFTFYGYPKEIHRSIYTSNPIESFNKKLKRNIRKKEQFPNEE